MKGKKFLCAAVAASVLASGLAANLSVTALYDSFSLALNGCTQNAEFTEDEEDKTVIFSATCRQFEGEEIELVDAQTEEVVAVMLDDGNFTDSGDDLENDGTWSARLSFDDYDVGTYPYYARIVDVDGTSATETLSVVIYEAVSDEDAARMAEITQLVSALLDDEAFQEADQETRKQMADEMFAEMIAEGYVKEGSVEYDADTYWYTYLCESVGGLSDVECILDIAIKEPNQVSSGSETDASCFTYTNHGDSIEITGFDGSVDDVLIPSEIEDLPVTEIGESAFASITVNSVVVPESVTYIAENAFQFCDSLNEITILNPSCEIYDSRTTITNCYIYLVSGEDLEHFTGTIYGYADSTAQTYAKTYGYAFAVIEENTSTGALRIVDENDDVSADIESEIIAQYAAAYPGVDLSDFSLVFLADQSAIYADYTSYYRFEMYYQDTYLLNRIVQVKVTAGGEVTASIMDESLINYCLTSFDSNYLSEEEILHYVCCEADDYILSDEPLSISLVVYTGDVTTSLTYAITYEHTDGERTFFLDAYTGMGLGWRSNWDDGIQYGWTGMMQLSYSKEDDGYTFTVESTYSDLDGWLTLADVDTGEDLAVMTEAGTTEDGYYRYTCSVTLPSDIDTTKTLYAYIEHDDLWPGDVSELEVSNYLTVDVSAASTTTTETTMATEVTEETTTTTIYCSYYELSGWFKLDYEPDKLTYTMGEELDLTGLCVELICGTYGEVDTHLAYYGNPLDDPEAFTVDTSAFDSSTPGEYTITVSCTEETIEEYSVNEPTSVSFTVTVVGDMTTETTTETTTTTTTTTTENGSCIVGDVNLDGKITLTDSILLRKYVAGLVDLSDNALTNADTYVDGYVDAYDALVLMEFQVQMIDALPIISTDDNQGDLIYEPEFSVENSLT